MISLEKRERGRIQGLPKFLGYPLLSQEREKRRNTDFKFGQYIQRVHPSEQKPFKILEKRERGRIQGLHKFFGVPPIIAGTGKSTNFKFCMHIHYDGSEQKRIKKSEK